MEFRCRRARSAVLSALRHSSPFHIAGNLYYVDSKASRTVHLSSLLKAISDIAALLANVLTAVASAIAIGLFFAKRKELSRAIGLLLNWSFQTTLSDLRGKLDRLNEYNANEPADLPEIKNILHEIVGQIRGNPRLQAAAATLANKVEALANSRHLTEPRKRSIVAESREVLRNVQIGTVNQPIGEIDE